MLSFSAVAHEWTPTYPELVQSHEEGINKVDMLLWNARKEIQYFSFEVFTEDWQKVPFATASRIVNVEYLERKQITIYIKETDNPTYICSRTKLFKGNKSATYISSRICSKIK